jgi:hypothetical protein
MEVPAKIDNKVPQISEEERMKMFRMNLDVGFLLAEKDETPSWSDDESNLDNGPAKEYDPLSLNMDSSS